MFTDIQFNLYHSILLPIVISNKNIVFIDPETQYLAISVDQEYLLLIIISLTDSQYTNCKLLYSFKLCEGLHYVNKHTENKNWKYICFIAQINCWNLVSSNI